MKRRNFLQSTLMVAGAALVGAPLLTKAKPVTFDPNVEVELTFYLEYLARASGALGKEDTRTVYLDEARLIIQIPHEERYKTLDFRFKNEEQKNQFINSLIQVPRPTELARREKTLFGTEPKIPICGVMDANWASEIQRWISEDIPGPAFRGRMQYIGPQVMRWCYRGEYDVVHTSPYRNEIYNVPSVTKYKHKVGDAHWGDQDYRNKI